MLSDLLRAGALLRIVVAANAGPLLRRAVGWRDAAQPYPVRLRHTLERLGTTYLKFGQFLAMRFDLLPMELCEELQRLFEHVPPMPAEVARAVIERELGAPLAHHFAEFDPEPIGAASIAQVHAARTCGGARVAVKVQRPGIEDLFEADMRILHRLARWLDRTGWFAGLPLQEIISEFAGFTRRELDFLLEGRTAERLRRQATAAEVVPRIHWSSTTRRVLTMDFIDGISIGEAAQLLRQRNDDAIAARLPGFRTDQALRNFAFASLHQLFTTGFFHADPHPGNILLLPDNRIAFVDFGIFGQLADEKREWLVGYTEHLAAGDIDGAYRYYAKLSTPTARTDFAAYQRDAKAVLRGWHDRSMHARQSRHERHVAKVIGDITEVMRRHHVRLDLDTLLFWRATIALDASALTLSDRFDLIREMRRYFARERPGPMDRLVDGLTDRARAADLHRVLRLAPQGWRHAVAADAARLVRRAAHADSRRAAQAAARAMMLAVLSIAALPLALTWLN